MVADAYLLVLLLLVVVVAVGAWWLRHGDRASRPPRQMAGHRRKKRGRYLGLIAVALLMSGCAADVVMLNPRTGDTRICRAHPMDPWSQQQACIGDLVTQGWKRSQSTTEP
jgi:hypothetical protein